MKKKRALYMLMAGIVLLSTACGKTDEDNNTAISEPIVEKVERNSDAEGKNTGGETAPENAQEEASTADAGENGKEAEPEIDAETAAIKKKFGEDCIAKQTFEVELSEYEGKVYFVPYAPTEDGQGFHMQMVRDGNILTDIEGYVPDEVIGKSFDSLDAVSFFDINYDGETDIILIETYGGVSFAAVYYGHNDGISDRASFFPGEELSEKLSACVEEMSVSGIRKFLSGGKRNGEFTDYREAYEAVMKFSALDNEEQGYDLIYFDEDDIPELTVGHSGYSISMFTYDDGMVYQVMDHWGYGAMGNAGYEYSQKRNSLRNYNADYAGAILYTTYMKMSAQHAMESVVEIVFYNFDDVNQNGIPDEDEEGSIGYYGVSYIDGKEVSQEECESYDMGEYQYMETDKDIEEIKGLLYTK